MFDWSKVTWSRPDSPQPLVCSICFGALADAPLTIWKGDGSAASFCDKHAADVFADYSTAERQVMRTLRLVDKLILLNSVGMAMWLPMPQPGEDFYWAIACVALALNCAHATVCLSDLAHINI